MTSIIKFSLKELDELVKNDKTCVSKKTVSQNISFQPWCLSNLKDSLEKIMNNKIGKYDTQLNGIILSYKNVKILDDVYAIHNDHSELHSDVEADFYIFHPFVGSTLRGIISKKSMTHLGVLVHKVFNVVIPTPSNQSSATWVGSKLNVGQQVQFKVVVLDLFGALPYIRGALDESCLPPIIDEMDNTIELDEESLGGTHVNFDGTKPKFLKRVKDATSPSLTVNGNGKETIESNDSKKSKNEECLPSDSDLVSDVDDAVLQEQDKIMKQMILCDKKRNKPLKSQPLTPSTPGLKKLIEDSNKKIKKKHLSIMPVAKEIKDSIVIRKQKISLVHSSEDCRVGTANSSSTPQQSISSSSKINGPYTVVLENNHSISPLKSKKDKFNMSAPIGKIYDESISKKDKKNRHSFDSITSDVNIVKELSNSPKKCNNLGITMSSLSKLKKSKKSDVTDYREEISHIKVSKKEPKSNNIHISPELQRSKIEKRVILPLNDYKKDADSIGNFAKSKMSEMNEVDEKKARKLAKKMLKERQKNISVYNDEDMSSSTVKNSNVNESPTSKEMPSKPKRKRKYSETFGSELVASVHNLSPSDTSPVKKKKKGKDKSDLVTSKITDSLVGSKTSSPEMIASNSEVDSSEKKKKRRRRNKEDYAEAVNNETSLDETEGRMKKVQDLLLQIASDPTLLTDIQSLIKSRNSL